MKDEIVSLFTRSCKEILLQVGKLEFKEKMHFEKKDITFDEIVAIVIGIAGGMKGQVIITISEEMTKEIVSNIHNGIPIAVIDQMVKKTILELFTMIVANAIVGLFNLGVAAEITSTSVMMGTEVSYYFDNVEIISIPFESNKEEIEVHLITRQMKK